MGGIRSSKARLEFSQRKAERYGAIGRAQEHEVEGLLCSSGEFDSVVRHAPHSSEDCSGMDFTVNRNGQARSFGMTISLSSLYEARIAHADVPQLYFPVGVTRKTVIRRVTELFE